MGGGESNTPSFLVHPLPLRALIILNTGSIGRRDWRGTSLLRPTFKPWKLLDDMYHITGILYARWGTSHPMVKMGQGVKKGSPEWRATEQTGAAIHVDEAGYIVVPDGIEIGVLEKEFTTAELLGHIQLDQQASVGSCALGQTLVNVFPQAVTTWAKYISEQFTC